MERKQDEEIGKWKIPVAVREELVSIIRQEWTTVNTQHCDGKQIHHKQHKGLIGIWKNTTLQRAIKLLTEKVTWTEENAMERIRDLAMINLKSAAEIEKILINIKKGMYTKIGEAELQMWRWLEGVESEWTNMELDKEEKDKCEAIKERLRWKTGEDAKEAMKQLELKIKAFRETKMN